MTGSASTTLQFRLLLWKNFTLRKRRPVFFCLEVLAPVVVILLLSTIRIRDLVIGYPPCHFQPKPLPSAGTFQWFSSHICNLNNSCFEQETDYQLDSTIPDLGPVLRSLSNLFIQGGPRFDNLVTSIFESSNSASSVYRNTTYGAALKEKFGSSSILRDRLTEKNVIFSDVAWYEFMNLTLNYSSVINRLPTLSNNVRCSRKEFQGILLIDDVDRIASFQEHVCNFTFEQLLLFRETLDQNFKRYDYYQSIVDSSGESQFNNELEFFGNLFLDLLDSFQLIFQDAQGLIPDDENPSEDQIRDFSRILCGENSDFVRRLDDTNITESESKRKRKKRSIPELHQLLLQRRKRTAVNGDQIFCRKLIGLLGSKTFRFLYDFTGLNLFLEGAVYYTPVNNITREIMRQANSTFGGIGKIVDFVTEWNERFSPTLYEELANGDLTGFLRDLTDSCRTGNDDDDEDGTGDICGRLFNWLNTSNTADYNWVLSLSFVDTIINDIGKYLGCFNWNKFIPTESEDTFNQADNEDKLWAGVAFDGLDDESMALKDFSHISVRIRMGTKYVDSTRGFTVFAPFWSPEPRRQPLFDMKYFNYGFIYLQDIIMKGMFTVLNGGKELNYGIHMQQMPYPCYSTDTFNLIVARSLPLFMTIGWIFAVSLSVRAIVYEKELRLKEVMRVMGLSNGMHWCAWLTTTLVLMTMSSILIAIFLKFGRILPESDITLVFFILMSFVMATISQAFLISVFFSKANIAATVSGIVFFVSYLPFNIVEFQEDALSAPILYAMCLLSPVAFGLSTQYLARYESSGKGMQWSDITESTAVEDPFNLAKCLAMLWLDAFLFAVLIWYIEGVYPGKYGVPRKFYFPFTREYWCGKAASKTDGVHYEWDDIQKLSASNTDFYENEPEGLTLGVAIRKLQKVYKNAKRPAVDDLSLNFYENQITSFLGHNGAGKTTTISILTGLYTPSGGTAFIYGRNITEDMDAIRRNLGLCPQFNVLFDQLTVEEHIYFYGMLKGMDEKDIENEISTFVKDVGLPHKRKEVSKNLSGGMKRKLSVAMAFVGGSKVVILDEPTAGVDPYARRSIWELLVRCRENRTIILTTHHMDEADILGDRIAIISNGKLKCCGTSLFLKNMFGSGYQLVLVKETGHKKDVTKSINNEQEEDVLSFIQRRVPTAELTEETDTEWVFKLPLKGLTDGSYQALFVDLDENIKQLKISSYGLSDTSLEEVFLKVADDPSGEVKDHDDNKTPEAADNIELSPDNGMYPSPVTRSSLRRSLSINSGKQGCIQKKRTKKKKTQALESNYCDAISAQVDAVDASKTEDAAASAKVESVQIKKKRKIFQDPELSHVCNGAGTHKVTGFLFVLVQFQALLIKRFHNFRRNKRGFIAEIIVPTLFILLACAAITISTNFSTYPPMELHPWLMQLKRTPNMNIFYSNSNVSNLWTENLVAMVRTPLGAGGVRCMNSTLYGIDGYPCDTSLNETWSSPGPNMTSIPQRTSDCICIKGRPQECTDSYYEGPDQSKRLLSTTDYLYDLTGYNISDYLLKTHNDKQKMRFGGFKFTKLSVESFPLLADKDIKDFFDNSNYSTLAIRINEFARSLLEPDSRVTVYFNNKGFASSVAYLSVAQNLLMRTLIYNNSAISFNKGISIFNHPLNLTYDNLLEDALLKNTISLVLAIFIIFALSFIPASFVLFLIDERVTYSKHLQFVSGLNPFVYWLANYLWDILNYLLAITLIILIFVAFQLKEFVSRDYIVPFLLLMIGYGISVIPFLYPASFLFKTSSTAFVMVSSLNFLIGLGTTLSVFIIQTLINDDIILERAFDFFSRAFLIFPQYCLGRGLIDLSRLYVTRELEIDFFDEDATALDFVIIGKNLLAMACQSVFYFLLVLFIERKFFCPDGCKCCHKTEITLPECEDEDEDVADERQRVLTSGADDDAVKLLNLTKIYNSKRLKRPAVNQLCLGIKRGQCFGLLGVNGAGKTSTFKMLTGQQRVTHGDAFVANKSVRSELIEVHRNIGYCPQFDALNNLLTGRETLTLYARLRGVPSKQIDWVVDWALERLSLQPHADKTAGAYSGGNKRKLSTAIALIGNPDVIFLDEPTSGMDPGAKRFLWNCILEIVDEGRCVILTTHSMEECEALCQRLCIMVNGGIKCLGSVQHLKCRFGDGYTVALKLNHGNIDSVNEVIDYMKEHFPQSILKELNYTLLEYQLGNETKLAQLFEALQNGKENLKLFEEYSVSQTTLDQVFIDFAKHQSEMFQEELEDAKQIDETSASVKDESEELAVIQTEIETPSTSSSTHDSKNDNESIVHSEESSSSGIASATDSTVLDGTIL